MGRGRGTTTSEPDKKTSAISPFIILRTGAGGLSSVGSFIWRFKTFLEENHLITPAEEHEETDLYYRIPGLEAGSLAFHQLASFLHQHQFVLNEDDVSDGTIRPVNRGWLVKFGSLVLPLMLLREVWDKVEESSPEFIHLKGSKRSHYLLNRIRDVVLFYIHKEGNKKRSMPTESQNLVDQHFIMDWPFFHEVHLEFLGQLTTDGVPRDRIFPRGLYDILMIWEQRSKLQPLRSLPQWTYDPSKDSLDLRKGDDSARLNQQGNTSAEPSEGYQDDQPVLKDDENCNNEESACIWPSDTRRYEVFAYRRPPQSQNTALDGRTSKRQKLQVRTEKALSTTGQHKVSSSRILAAPARDVHHQGFIDDDYTEQQFWEHLWYRLYELQWSIASDDTLKKRFSWVLYWVREDEMPLEPLSFVDSLLQVWYGAEGALESVTHPYNIPPGCCFNRELINPDLDPRWVEGILAHGDSAQKVRSRLLKYHKLDISHDDIYNKYGILLPYVWEKAYAQGYLNSRSDLFQPKQTHEDATSIEPDELDDISDRASQSEAEEVRKAPAKPVTQAQAAKLEVIVMEIIRDDYQSQNGSTWMWLHLQRTHLLGRRGNGVLLKKILDVDPDFASKEKRICMKLRMELKIVDYVEDEEFSWHGRRLPPSVIAARHLRLPWPQRARFLLAPKHGQAQR
ncbi:hypothetical protein K469DRAFT_694853 [Zopfia rhizophila CBS 207.26]|uniref:Uncharacterized protein n=1 Tax=Zopfia rhizophila CBS 207.26 TaxID=1314779 RepID=A0A6A6ENQ8_9PEZI|nr:hypothetical protein K469DRAFT_694853 [Zopfia rhizophila CBS 207.26]